MAWKNFMTPNRKEIIEKLYGFSPNENVLEKLKEWEQIFIEYNSHTNLMSKNDVNLLFEKHVLDSLAIKLYEGFYDGLKILDIGAGGGFPSLILSMFFPDNKIIAVDSVRKKTDFLNLAKEKLQLSNLDVINERSENIAPINADILVNRAVGKIEDVWNFSKKHLKIGGAFISYKAKTAEDEAEIALKKYRELKLLNMISYNLPLDENYTRKLVILKKA